jgi:hypothetical protein
MKFNRALLTFSLLLLLVNGAQAYPITLERDKQYEVKFSRALSAKELAMMVETYKLEPREIKFEIPVGGGEAVFGGYTVSDSETIREAIKNMLARHIGFLESALPTTEEQLMTETDPVLVAGLRQWNQRFAALLKDAKKGNLAFSAIKVNGSALLGTVALNPQIRSVTLFSIQRDEIAETLTQPFMLNAAFAQKPSWAPFKGSSKVTKRMIFQIFYFDDVSAFDSLSSYEHETQVYEKKFASYDNFYDTNLPGDHYKDTTALDFITNRDCGCTIFGVGTLSASKIKTNTLYWSNMSLKPGTKDSAKVIVKGQIGRMDAVRTGWRSQWNVRGIATEKLFTLTAPAQTQIKWTH